MNGHELRESWGSSTFDNVLKGLQKQLKNGEVKFWGFTLRHSKTDQAGIGFRLDLTPGTDEFPIFKQWLQLLQERVRQNESITPSSPAFAFHSEQEGTDGRGNVMVYGYDTHRKIDKMLSARFDDSDFAIQPHSRRAGFVSRMLDLQCPVYIMKILLRHSNGAISVYLHMSPQEKIKWQVKTLRNQLLGTTRPSTKERKEIEKILVL